jgi:hypothetical protein
MVPGSLTSVSVLQQNVAGAQETLRGLVDAVSSWVPKVPAQVIERIINARIREIVRAGHRPWYGLLVKGILNVPALFNAGLVTLATGSNIVTISGTTLPVSDVVNTTITTAPSVLGVQTATLASVTNIDIGDWLTVDAGLGTEEQILVTNVDTVGKKIRAKFQQLHNNGAPVTMSSLVRRQFRISFQNPIYTIRGVRSATQFILDQAYGGAAVTNSGYTIMTQIVNFGRIRQLLAVSNPLNSYGLVVNVPGEVIDRVDSSRTSASGGYSYVVGSHIPNEVGIPQYELYPIPSSASTYTFLAARQVDDLVDEEDTPPCFIDTDVLVSGVVARCYLWGDPKTNPYYSIQNSRYFEQEFKTGIVEMAVEDDNPSLQSLIWDGFKYPIAWGGSEWLRSHDGVTSFGYP